MKTRFGSWLSRQLHGGCTLTSVEHYCLARLVEISPTTLRPIIERQFDAYDIVQREIDGRALNFFVLRKSHREALETFSMQTETMRLCRLKIEADGVLITAVLMAVSGRAFCINFDKCVHKLGKVNHIREISHKTART